MIAFIFALHLVTHVIVLPVGGIAVGVKELTQHQPVYSEEQVVPFMFNGSVLVEEPGGA